MDLRDNDDSGDPLKKGPYFLADGGKFGIGRVGTGVPGKICINLRRCVHFNKRLDDYMHQ